MGYLLFFALAGGFGDQNRLPAGRYMQNFVDHLRLHRQFAGIRNLLLLFTRKQRWVFVALIRDIANTLSCALAP